MAGVSLVRREYVRIGAVPTSAVNDEYYGRRMQMLMSAGAGRFLDIDPDSLVGLAAGPDPDEDMMDIFLGAFDQNEFNLMRQRFEAMPTQMQRAEFNLLPMKTQNLLRGAGYQFPEEKDPEGLLKRIFTWDIPLLPEEHFGTAIKVGLAPIRAVGFGLGTVARNVWEFGIMKPSRFATRFGRSLAFMGQRDKGDFSDPTRWRDAWNKTRLEDDSYYQSTLDAAIEKVGGEQVELMRIFLRDGGQGVYDHLAERGEEFGYAPERIADQYQRWYDSLADPANTEALEILDSGRLTIADASVKAWNRYGVWDVTPGTKPAAVVGMVGSLAVEILLDPTTWVGGFWIKIAKVAKFGHRAKDGAELIDFMRRGTLLERAASETGFDAFSKIQILDRVTGEYSDGLAGIKEWMKSTGVNVLGRTNFGIRLQLRAINRLIDRVTDAFQEIDEIAAFKQHILDNADEVVSGTDLRAAITEQFGKGTKLDALLRDMPALNQVIDSMRNWHFGQRRTVIAVDDESGELIRKFISAKGAEEVPLIRAGAAPTLADEQGFWEFLADDAGWMALAKPLGRTDPEALFLPRIGAFGAKWMGAKKYMREILDFDDFPLAVKADIARMTSKYLAKQSDYVHSKIFNDIQEGTLELSKPIDQDTLFNILRDPSQDHMTRLGLTSDDWLKIDEYADLHQADASQIILEDSELSDLLNYYLHNGFEVRLDENDVRRLLPKRGPDLIPFSGAGKAAHRYYKNRVHPPGSTNAELTWLEEIGAIGGAVAAGLAYYPARFAEKLTTYVPKSTLLDVTDADTAVKEFTALIDMGVMSGMPRTQIDQYLRTFVMGNDSERWLVQHDFFLDFIGRTGALVHGGRDVQDFIQKFVRHGTHRYAQITDDLVGIHGMNVPRAVFPGAEHGAQLARANIIPNYRELAAISRYTAFYRMAGWGIHLPTIDKFLARTWRPAVLLRLGYVARNGGEELFSWWLREGPKNWANHKIARAAIDKHVVWDEYGRKILKDIDPEEQLPILWKPFSRLWRSFNEIGGVGDYAITEKAIREAASNNPNWKFISDEARASLFEASRVKVKRGVEETLIGGMSRRMFEFANAKANELSMLTNDFMGVGASGKMARWIGRKIDKQHDERARVIAEMMTDPTILDQQMKDILGTFDNYINPDSVDRALRTSGFGTPVDLGLRLPMDYGSSGLEWVTTEAGTEMDAVPKSIAVTQRLNYMSDPEAVAYLRSMSHYASPQQEAVLAPLAAELGLEVAADEVASAVVLKHLQTNHKDALKVLAKAFDARPTDPDALVTKLTANDAFLDKLPEDVQPAFRAFLEPAPGVDQNPNVIAFLISGVDPAKIITDFDDAVVQAKRALFNELMTVRGEQAGRSAHVSNVGFDITGGPISESLPDGAARLFVPMIPMEHVDSLIRLLSEGGGARFQWFNEFVEKLEHRFIQMGLSSGEAFKAARLLQPSLRADTIHHTPGIYAILAGSWTDAGMSHIPLMTGSANPDIADAIAKTITEMLGPITRLDNAGPDAAFRLRSRIGTIDVNAEELYGVSPAPSRVGLNGPTIAINRGGLRTSMSHPDVAVRGDVGEVSSFYGWTKEGPTTAADFGSGGMSREKIIGIGGEQLMYRRADGGVQGVQMVNDTPVTYTSNTWRNKKNGSTIIRRAGDERAQHWYTDNPELWEIVDTQFTAHNDFHNAMLELTERMSPDILDLVSSGTRADVPEVFLPWIREVTHGDEISALRVNAYANDASWWNKAPERVLALKPVGDEGGGLGERMGRAWNTLLRNWFDGVVNPMIGAMVREPMFQHYYLVASKQVAGVKRNYHHTKGGFQALSARLGDLASYDDEGQLVVDSLRGFIRHDWQLAWMDPEAAVSRAAFAVEHGNAKRFAKAAGEVLEDMDGGAVEDALSVLMRAAEADSPAIHEFFKWAKIQKNQFEVHRNVSLQRAMTLTSAFIDDHRIRSQFQEMVGTAMPFWFAEDQFLRRMGRGLKQNPLMLRNLHLTMNAGVRGGLVQEDQFGEKKLVVPGSEVLTTAVLEIADKFPIVNSVFGGPLGAVMRPKLATSINVIPGYDLEQIGQMGFGPLLSVPINFASGRDASLRATFEHNMIGGRYTGSSKLTTGNADSVRLLGETIWSSVLPAVLARPLQLMGIEGPNGNARAKAKIDVIKFMALNDMLPTEQEVASQANPELFREEFLDKVDQMAKQYQLLQALTWFFGPATGQFSDLVVNDKWEWNTEFHDLLNTGMPYEEAYPIWIKNVEARTGETFNPVEFSPFRTSASSKVPFAVLESTQAANEWLVDNDEFTRNFGLSSAFFMPRKFDVDDDEYVAEAKQRQINMGLRTMDTPEEFLEELYYNIASPAYHTHRIDYLQKKYVLQKQNLDTQKLDRSWKFWYDGFKIQHPVFAQRIITGTAKVKREETVDQFRLLVETPELVPEGDHRLDILNAMATIVGFQDKLNSLTGLRTADAQRRRDAIRYKYWKTMELFTQGKPWLNEIYYSVFLPMVNDSWVAKYRAGLVEVNPMALAA